MRPAPRRAPALAACAALLLALVAPIAARAQGAGRSMDIDTSVRALGMGGTSAGVAWGDAELWGNVASLARVRGVHWEHGRAQLVPGLAADVVFRTNRLLVGGEGFGASLFGVPGEPDGVRLDYGLSEQVDINGNLISTFAAFETVRGWAAGASASGVAGLLARDRAPAWLGPGLDVALGVARKRTLIHLAPASLSGEASATTWDWGLQARVSPIDLVAATATEPPALAEWAVCDVGLGYGVVNAAGGDFVFVNEDQSSPATRIRRRGAALRVGAHVPRTGLSGALATLCEGLDPLVCVTVAIDHEEVGAGSSSRTYDVDHDGFEIAVANVLFIRRGHWADYAGDIDGETQGWGVGLPLGPWAGWRYEESTVPQAKDSGLPDVKHVGWTAWIDPLRIARDARAKAR